MKVFKFGGASVKSAQNIRNVASIIQRYQHEKLLVVVSAMGSTTDALERVIALSQNGKSYAEEIATIHAYHTAIIDELFEAYHPVKEELEKVLQQIEGSLQITGEYDKIYDQVIGYGEILSSIIITHFLTQQNLPVQWIDARQYIKTDSCYREGKVQWEQTEQLVQQLKPLLAQGTLITQGFIGSSPDGLTITLGREGSDFSAAIFGYCLSAESVTIWKDVPGVMSADPKRIPNAIVFDELPYKEAAEMTYFGASVIHPKTIKPLANRKIPLNVKSFVNPSLAGTVIHDCHVRHLPPLIVYKGNQCLISCKVLDYTFINEEQMGIIFNALTESNNKMNVMQNSAISFSFCVDYRESKVMKLVELLSKNFDVYYNTNLTLITVKNYDTKTFDEYRQQQGVVLEQSSRSTLQVLVKG